MQQWAARFFKTPDRWLFRNIRDLRTWERRHKYPVMVKGMRKGAVKCNDTMEAWVARKAVLKNPANTFLGGGAYIESYVPGEEHSLLAVFGMSGQLLAVFGFRKLAKTQLGTTLCGQVSDNMPLRGVLPRLIAEIQIPMTIEIESRLDDTGQHWVFEVNPRFPSWIGALGEFGQSVVESYVSSVLDVERPSSTLSPPEAGTLLYRLPESGFLSLSSTFCNSEERPRNLKPLWRGCSPHQFMIK
jgi:hypothetical protein